jgi:outer membrane protein assembly factor BamA
VREGARARLAAVGFEGASVADAVLSRVAGLSPGSDYDQPDTLAAADRLRVHYYGLGHPSVRVTPRVRPEGGDLAVVFGIAEGERVTIGRVAVSGLRHVREGLVRRVIGLDPGDPLDPRAVAEAERRLMDLGRFRRAAATVSDDNPATVTFVVDEGERIVAGYLASYDDERNARGEVEGELRGLLGAGLSLGARVSAAPGLRDVRGHLDVPAFLPTGGLTLSAFRLSEDLPLVEGQEDGETFRRVLTGGQLQATRPLAGRWDLLYGYRVKRVTIDSVFLSTTRWVAGVDLSVLRDTRDDTLDARRGSFLSLTLEVAPKALGSDFDFVKGYAQAVFNRPLRERWTWAHAYRLGLAHVYGGEPLVSDEGFEAGGANSIRGYAVASVGPEGYRFGRQAVLVVNQELRYHHPSGLGGAIFYDTGNTFATAGDLSPRELRHALGAGVRWISPVGLLRLDVGFPLDRREGESAARVFFSFGQAF